MRLASRRILLVGAGHTNLHIVRMWMQQPIPDTGLTLISPFPCATYSGMLPGTLAGLYAPFDMEIDLHRLTKAAGVELIVDEAVKVDALRKEVLFRERPPVTYDVASIGVGSVPLQMDCLKTHPGFVAIKPMYTALQRLDSAIQRNGKAPVRTAIVGGGAAGLEVAFCAEQRIRKAGGRPQIALIDANSQILRGFRPRTIRLAEHELQQRGIDVRYAGRVTGHNGLDLILADGSIITADVVIWVTGACPPPLLQQVNLPRAESGFLRIQNTLQSVGDKSVFVVGDSAEMDGEDIDRAGVYAVRQGPILWQNLNRCLQGSELIPYKPQRDFLRLLATGDGRAIVQWKWFAGIGAHWWRLKDRIDSKFMHMHRPSGSMKSQSRKSSLAGMEAPSASQADSAKMRCRGCGGKTSSRVLHRVLQRLRAEWPSSHQGFLQSDDTALLPDTTAANAVSVDFFPAFLDDPWLTGRIAAIHALSDLWACGVQPTSAVAMVTLPEGSLERQSEMLHHVLSGAIREFTTANAVLVGGHTTNGDELSVGFTVFGKTHGGATDRLPLSKANLRPGQQLILTKALGTGVILAANESGLAESRAMSAAIDMMLQTNQQACNIAIEEGVAAATDITGFGLSGHLLEMCQQSEVSVDVEIESLPLIFGAARQILNGIRSSLYDENKAAVQDFVVIGERLERELRRPGSPPDAANEQATLMLSPLQKLEAMYDPQTSGGLLMGVDAEQSDHVLARLAAAGYRDAAIIGRVVDGLQQRVDEEGTTVRIHPVANCLPQ
ncbi:MAG: selenide, water dikinase SelD [Fuerstia sp.]|nr:selenide, water dikinase SelD [Fuerstiella sp.]